MSIVNITNEISVLPASNSPLSADVIIIKAPEMTWIFDTGTNSEALDLINSIEGPKSIVISHFHQDHAGNLKSIRLNPGDRLYGGSFTVKKYSESGMVSVEKALTPEPSITLFPLPSTHAKGCIGLCFTDYAFVGDGTYGTSKNGEYVFNVSLLSQTIRTLESLSCSRIYLSHQGPAAIPLEQEIKRLREIYAGRVPGETYAGV